MAQLAQPGYEALMGQEITLSYGRDGLFLLGLLGVLLAVGLLAGSYPALLLSGLHPVDALREASPAGARTGLLRKGLVVAQFAASIALIISTGVIYQQLSHLRTADPGFDEEQVVVVKLDGEHIQKQFTPLKTKVLRHPNVVSASASYSVPGPDRSGVGAGLSLTSSLRKVKETEGGTTLYRSEHEVQTRLYYVDADFPETYKLRWIRKQDALWENPSRSAMLISEALADRLGSDTTSVLGEEATANGRSRIAGIVEDFHFGSLREAAAPMAIVHDPGDFGDDWAARRLSVRIRPEDVPATLDHLRQAYASFSPSEPFQYVFLDDHLDRLYKSEERLARLFGVFAVLTILIACLGLFGLAAYMAERRTKEIGIRKVFGASVSDIVMLLSKDFAKLILVAVVIAVPVAYYAMSRWLQDFAYRIELSPWIFVGAGAAALVIALATVSYQAVKAALADPVDAIRYE